MVRNGTNQAQVVDERTPLTSSRDLVHGQGTIKIPHDDAQEVQSSENVSVARSILPTLLFGESLLSWPITSPGLTIMQDIHCPGRLFHCSRDKPRDCLRIQGSIRCLLANYLICSGTMCLPTPGM